MEIVLRPLHVRSEIYFKINITYVMRPLTNVTEEGHF
jgi:hypothetical protein